MDKFRVGRVLRLALGRSHNGSLSKCGFLLFPRPFRSKGVGETSQSEQGERTSRDPSGNNRRCRRRCLSVALARRRGCSFRGNTDW
jgi:hypothetical protein